jgi:polyphosphate kinase
MSDPGIASGYRSISPSQPQLFNQRAGVQSGRERDHAPVGTSVWPKLPERCFGAGRQLPEWLIRPWLLLQEAAQRRRPLSERLTDLIQVAQSLDDLFAVHLPVEAEWFQCQEAAGLSIDEHIPRWVDELIGEATQLFLHQLRPELIAGGIYVRSVAQLDEWQRDWLYRHFMERIYPLLTPLAVDPGRPFPYISSDSLNLLVELHRVDGVPGGNILGRNSLFARVKVPRATPRLVAVPTQPNGIVTSNFAPTVYVCSADLVRYFVQHLFTGMPVRHVYLFRLVRGEHPLPGACASTSTRHRRQEDKPVVRLDVEQRMSAPVLNWLMEHLRLPAYALAQHDRLFDWSCLPNLVATLGVREAQMR